MIRTLIAFLISLALSACLLYGDENLHLFAFVISCVFNGIAWLGLLTNSIKGEVAARLRRGVVISLVSSLINLYALIASGHPFLAASGFIVQFFIVSQAFASKEKASCERRSFLPC